MEVVRGVRKCSGKMHRKLLGSCLFQSPATPWAVPEEQWALCCFCVPVMNSQVTTPHCKHIGAARKTWRCFLWSLSHLKISRLSSNKLVELQLKQEGFNYCSLTWYREPERDLHLQQIPGTTKTRNHSFEPAKHPRNHSPESAKKTRNHSPESATNPRNHSHEPNQTTWATTDPRIGWGRGERDFDFIWFHGFINFQDYSRQNI